MKRPVFKSAFHKVEGLSLQRYLKETPTQVLSCEYCQIFKSSLFYKTPPVAATVHGHCIVCPFARVSYVARINTTVLYFTLKIIYCSTSGYSKFMCQQVQVFLPKIINNGISSFTNIMEITILLRVDNAFETLSLS